MSVEQINIIDFIGLDIKENVVLTISDHLEWDLKNEHLLILQNKINAYLNAIDTGDLYNSYPKAKGKRIIISVVAKHQPDETGKVFLSRVKEIIENSGYGFEFKYQASAD